VRYIFSLVNLIVLFPFRSVGFFIYSRGSELIDLLIASD
jgi:hypothetical protein